MMRVYVAGASKELPLVQSLQNQLRSHGVHVTHDWTADVLAAKLAGKVTDSDLSHAEAYTAAEEDLRGVATAHFVWLVAPADNSTSIGGWVELGYALGRGVPVVTSWARRDSIFAALVAKQCAVHTEAVAWLLEQREACSVDGKWDEMRYAEEWRHTC